MPPSLHLSFLELIELIKAESCNAWHQLTQLWVTLAEMPSAAIVRRLLKVGCMYRVCPKSGSSIEALTKGQQNNGHAIQFYLVISPKFARNVDVHRCCQKSQNTLYVMPLQLQGGTSKALYSTGWQQQGVYLCRTHAPADHGS